MANRIQGNGQSERTNHSPRPQGEQEPTGSDGGGDRAGSPGSAPVDTAPVGEGATHSLAGRPRREQLTPAEQLLERVAKAGTTTPSDAQLERSCPLLWSLLTQTRFRDGTIRVPASLEINASDGWWLVTLRDHASHQQCSCYAETLAEVPQSLENIMANADECWRPYKSRKVQNPFKRKKPLGP